MAGVLPYAIDSNGQLLFLFHKTFVGKKVGMLIDFGGGREKGEDITLAAVREFCEETFAIFVTDEPNYDRLQHVIENEVSIQKDTFVKETIKRVTDELISRKGELVTKGFKEHQ